MKDFKKIINPCKATGYHKNGEEFPCNAFCEITYKNGNLSIHGVVGPISNGDCYGSCGQCTEEIRKGVPKDPWTQDILLKFCDIWDEWHLNNMKPYCSHMKELGWDKQAEEKIIHYHYKINEKSRKIKEEAKESALKALKEGIPFFPKAEETFYTNLETFYDTYDKIEEGSELAKYYIPYKSCIGTPAEEIKTRGWVHYTGTDKISICSNKGLLCKPCPVCGYKYGSSWIKEEVPEDVLEFLYNLPDSEIQPAWV